MRRCPNCGGENPEYACYCGKCGTKMSNNGCLVGIEDTEKNIKQGEENKEFIDDNGVISRLKIGAMLLIGICVIGYFASCMVSDDNNKENRDLSRGSKTSDKEDIRFSEDGGEKSDVEANTWYVLKKNDVVHFKNAEIRDAVLMSKRNVFMINYFPVCYKCHITGEYIQMTGVSPDKPVSEAYICPKCGSITYARFKIEY